MVTISHIVRNLINQKPMIYEGLIEGVISHANLADYLQKDIENELGEEANLPAIVMAIRRYSESLQSREDITSKYDFKFNSEIIMKTGLADITVVKTPTCMETLKSLYSLVSYDKGDTLNVIQGNYEITIVITEKYLENVKNILKDEKILNIESNLVSLSISFSDDFLYTPGIISKVTRTLSWENINIYENISTMTELIYIIGAKDSVKAYKALQNLVQR